MIAEVKRAFYLFLVISIVFFPFQYHFFQLHTQVIQYLFAEPVFKLGNWLGIDPFFHDFSSDSKNLFVLTGLLLIISIISAMNGIFKDRITTEQMKKIATLVGSLFLSLIMIKYGFDKIFKHQFPLPEPNLLFTPLGQLDKDILYWSTMGSSYGYNLFLGCTELLTGILLFFRKTRAIGALAAVFICANIVAVNFSFDISVKLLSSFLLLLSLFIAIPYIQLLITLSNKNNTVQPNLVQTNKQGIRNTTQVILGIAILIESLFPYILSGNFNDDNSERPALHGSYEIIPENFDERQQIRRIHLHRDGYMIFQDWRDELTAYELNHDPIRQKFILRNIAGKSSQLNYSWKSKDSLLSIDGIAPSKQHFRKVNLDQLPLVTPLFHWTVD